MRVLVSGSREPLTQEVEARVRGAMHACIQDWAPQLPTLIHGGAPGVDDYAASLAEDFDWTTELFEADWERYGKAAGPLRNQKMLDEGRPDLVLCFPLPGSKGTWDMAKRAVDAGVRTRVLLP